MIDLKKLAELSKAATPGPWGVLNETDIDTNLDGDNRHCEWMAEITAKNEDASEYLTLLVQSCGLRRFALPAAALIVEMRNSIDQLVAETMAAREEACEREAFLKARLAEVEAKLAETKDK